MRHIRRQVGVSLSDFIKRKIYKIAKIEERSVSSFCAEAIAVHVDRWMLKARTAPQLKEEFEMAHKKRLGKHADLLTKELREQAAQRAFKRQEALIAKEQKYKYEPHNPS